VIDWRAKLYFSHKKILVPRKSTYIISSRLNSILYFLGF
jgi:hypothetical protein